MKRRIISIKSQNNMSEVPCYLAFNYKMIRITQTVTNITQHIFIRHILMAPTLYHHGQFKIVYSESSQSHSMFFNNYFINYIHMKTVLNDLFIENTTRLCVNIRNLILFTLIIQSLLTQYFKIIHISYCLFIPGMSKPEIK